MDRPRVNVLAAGWLPAAIAAIGAPGGRRPLLVATSLQRWSPVATLLVPTIVRLRTFTTIASPTLVVTFSSSAILSFACSLTIFSFTSSPIIASPIVTLACAFALLLVLAVVVSPHGRGPGLGDRMAVRLFLS